MRYSTNWAIVAIFRVAKLKKITETRTIFPNFLLNVWGEIQFPKEIVFEIVEQIPRQKVTRYLAESASRYFLGCCWQQYPQASIGKRVGYNLLFKNQKEQIVHHLDVADLFHCFPMGSSMAWTPTSVVIGRIKSASIQVSFQLLVNSKGLSHSMFPLVSPIPESRVDLHYTG